MTFVDRYERELVEAARRRRAAETARRRRRRPLFGLAGLATAAALGVTIVLAWPGEGRLSPLEEARAALGTAGEIVHYVVDEDFRLPAEPSNPGDCHQDGPIEGWSATSGEPRWKAIVPGQAGENCGYGGAADGSPVDGPVTYAYAPRTFTSYVPAFAHVLVIEREPGQGGQEDVPPGLNVRTWVGDDQAQDPQTALRGLLATPGLRDEGVSRRDGRAVRTFVIPEPVREGDAPQRPKDGTVTYVVDAETFAPRSITRVTQEPIWEGAAKRGKQRYGRATLTVTFTAWERFPLDAEHEGLLQITPPPGASVTRMPMAEVARTPEREKAAGRRKAQRLIERYRATGQPQPWRP